MPRKKYIHVVTNKPPDPKPGMRRYNLLNYSPEVLHDIRCVIDDLRKSIERYNRVCEEMRWVKMFPLSMVMRQFYTKYQLHLQGLAVANMDDSVKNGLVDPDTYKETSKGIENTKKWNKLKEEIWK